MKLYYIDDTILQDSTFAKEVLERFLCRVRFVNKGIICMSSTHKKEGSLQQLKDELEDFIFLESPAVFECAGIRGSIHNGYLALEGYERLQIFSGSCIEIDLDTHEVTRIYLDLFPKHYYEDDLDQLMEQLEEMLNEKMKDLKKNKEHYS